MVHRLVHDGAYLTSRLLVRRSSQEAHWRELSTRLTRARHIVARRQGTAIGHLLVHLTLALFAALAVVARAAAESLK